MTIDEILRRAAQRVDAQQRARFAAKMHREAYEQNRSDAEQMQRAQAEARMSGAVDFVRGSDGIWRMPP